MRSRTLTTVTVALLAAVAFETAMAFELLQPPRRWFPPDDEPRVVMVDTNGLADIDDGGNGGVNAAINAANAWNNPPVAGAAGLTLIDAQGDANARNDLTLGDGVSHMIFTDPFRACERTCLAATFIGYYDTNQTATCGGFDVVKVDDSDIVFNAAPGFGPFRIGWTSEGEDPNGVGCSTEIYVESVASHEVGHLTGLDHEGVEVALMNPSADYCDNKPILPDDVEGRDQLYHCAFDGGGGSGCQASCDGVAVECNEVCDGGSVSCGSLGYQDNGLTAACNSNCNGYDTNTCAECAASETLCDDGIDNDCGGGTDCNDSDCSSHPSCSTDGLPKGAECTFDSECQSGKCKGPRTGVKTCK